MSIASHVDSKAIAVLTSAVIALFILVVPVAALAAERPPESESVPLTEVVSASEITSSGTSKKGANEKVGKTKGKPVAEEPVEEEFAAMSAMSSSTSSGNSTGGHLGGAVSTLILPESDSVTGALNYSVPLVVPPGRNEMQPDLRLVYSSLESGDGNLMGAGWSVPIPYIELVNKKGVEKLYTEPVYRSSLSGELVEVSAGVFKAKTEDGSFLAYTLTSGAWTATNRAGKTFKFGTTAASRQDDTTGTKIYGWMLDEVRDSNDNYVKYEYFKDQGQVYPSKVKYTGSGTVDGIFEVEFLREIRTDVHEGNRPAFPVKTDYRISEIQVKVSGNWIRKYDFAYTTGDNGVRSLLASVTESGKDELGVVTTLPATSFAYQEHDIGWNGIDPGWKLPKPFVDSSSTNKGVRLVDVNGDGRVDVVDGFGNNPTWPVYLNNGTGWDTTPAAGWNLPEPVVHSNGGIDAGTRFADLNGDSLVDIIRAYEDNMGYLISKVYLNNGSGWTLDTSWSVPHAFTNYSHGHDRGSRLADVNGDGLPDFLRGASPNYNEVHINTGSGWVLDINWSMPLPFVYYGSTGDLGTRLIDMNGDGLVDFVQSYTQYLAPPVVSKVYINTGTGWALDSNRTLPLPVSYRASYADIGGRIADLNGDGLPDMVLGRTDNWGLLVTDVYINTGTGWTQESGWGPPEAFVNFGSWKWRGLQLDDVDSDGLVDVIYGGYQNQPGAGCIAYQPCPRTYLNKGEKADLLKEITYSQGGTTGITYKTTQQHALPNGDRANTELPFIIDTVDQLEHQADASSASVTTTFLYEGGDYYYGGAHDRRFAGFAAVTKEDSVGNTEKTFFHQGNSSNSAEGENDDHWSKIGRSYRTETRDSVDNLYSKSVTKWEKTDLQNDRWFIYPERATEFAYDGDASHKDKSETYTYDTSNGNLTSLVEWGDVTASDDGSFTDSGSDKRTTATSYVTSTGFTALKKQETVTDQSATIVSDSKFYYDTLGLGSANKGNLTKEEKWVAGSTWVNSQKTYNSYGLSLTETDPRGKVTTYAYDPHNLYPATVTNPLSQAVQYLYDYSLGAPKQFTDLNSRVYQTVYDGLDRIIEEKQPDVASPSTLVTKSKAVYTDTAGSVNVKKSEYLDGSTIADTYSYFDGLGRLVQERKEAEGSNFSTRDLEYNNRGLLLKESLPYFSVGSAKTAATTNSDLYSTYVYDTLDRITSATDVLGSTTSAYDDRNVTVTDHDGKVKVLTDNAYGNLIQVDERNGASVYVTGYEYSHLGNLTKITDALGNVRSFTYDGLGRRLTAEDLHAPADPTFGIWTYIYDNAGNITSKTDPKAQVVNYTYDDVNRLLTEDFTGQAGIEVTNTYDTGTDGIGHLATTTNAAISKALSYDALGRVRSETSTISAVGYQTDYTYDRQGNEILRTEPDLSQVKYVYNGAGLLEQVQRKESSDPSFVNVISNFDRSPLGQLTVIAHANGATTTNTYDSSKLYRLSTKVTTIAGGVKAQDIAYTYSNAGDVTKIVDSSATNAKKTVDYTYDDLHRLLTATATNVAAGQSGYTETYTYNAIGNLLSKTGQGSYVYSGTGYANPHAATTIGGTALTYDNNGNLLTHGTSLTNTWDYGNRLAQSVVGANTSTYSYDSVGIRVKLVDGATTTYYPTSSYNVSGSVPTKHISAEGLNLATVTGTGASAVPHYVHTDHLTGGNVVTDAANAQEELLDYLPFGSIRLDQRAGSFDEQRKYAGHEYDASTGLSYMKARYYDAATGRFISQDPMFLDVGAGGFEGDYQRNLRQHLSLPQSHHSYAYANNNPLKLTDPDGEAVPFVLAAGSVALTWYSRVSAAILAYEAKTMLVDYPEVWTAEQRTDMKQRLGVEVAGMGLAGGSKAFAELTDIKPAAMGGVLMDTFSVFKDAVSALMDGVGSEKRNSVRKPSSSMNSSPALIEESSSQSRLSPQVSHGPRQSEVTVGTTHQVTRTKK